MLKLKRQRFSAMRSEDGAPHAFASRVVSAAAFTLVELLVVMMIMGILASMVLFALASAQETAKRDKTLSTINKLNALIMAKYETYKTRRVPIDVLAVAECKGYVAPIGDAVFDNYGSIRLDALADLMRLEMPDRLFRHYDDPITRQLARNRSSPMHPVPALQTSYQAQLQAHIQDIAIRGTAECLYLIITKGIDDPDVLEQFSPSEIGDTRWRWNARISSTVGDSRFHFLRWAPAIYLPASAMDVNHER